MTQNDRKTPSKAPQKLAHKLAHKLGRNPLQKLDGRGHSTTPGLRALGVESHEIRIPTPRSIDKIREMQIEVDWGELYASTIGRQVKKFSRFLRKN